MNSSARSIPVALIGECMIELQRLPSGALSQTFGGDTFNTAAYLARVGAPFGFAVEYVSAVGEGDAFSAAMVDFWHNEGVGSALTQRLTGKLPGLYFIELDDKGERLFRYWRGESAARECFDSPGSDRILERLGDFEAVHLSGISLAVLHPNGRERLIRRLETLAERGVSISFDFNFRPRLWGADQRSAVAAARPWYARMVALSGTVLLTVEEGEVIGLDFYANNTQNPDAALHASCAALGCREVVVKNGGESCLVFYKSALARVPAQKLERVVDTTAAGDSFAAAYLVGRRIGLAPEEAAHRAHCLAARVVSHRGAVIPKNVMPRLFDDVHT